MASHYTGNLTSGLETSRNDTTASDVGTAPIPTVRILVCLGLFVIVLVTIVGNIIVIVAFVIEKKLRTPFTFYILNLAITDVSVAVTAMSFYTFDILLGWWPFGEVRHIHSSYHWIQYSILNRHNSRLRSILECRLMLL